MGRPGVDVPALRCERIVKTYRHVPVLDGVSLAVAPGEGVALLGPNGAGKTTLIRIFATLARASSGVVSFFGKSAREHGPALRSRIGFASHDTLLYPDLTVAENLRLHARLHRAEADMGRLLARHGLAGFAAAPARHLSRGAAQRASLARALLHRPALLLLDEPFAGLDGPARDRIAGMLDEARRERRAALVLATHDVDRGLRLVDRAVVIRRGRPVLERPASDREAIRAAYSGSASA